MVQTIVIGEQRKRLLRLTNKAGAAVRVVRPEWLSEDLPKVKSVLTDEQIDLIARQLDLRCRDVED